MNIGSTVRCLLLSVGLILALPAQAALEARDLDKDGMIDAYYDTVLGITWLKDANLVASNTFGVAASNLFALSDIVARGTMTWDEAQSWIAAMNAANYLGYGDWRLPHVSPINGSYFNYISGSSYAGIKDQGYNISAPGTAFAGGTGSEMAYMYYQNLGNQGAYTPSGAASGCWVSWPSDTCLDNSAPFINLLPYEYWSGVEAESPLPDLAWAFHMAGGGQAQYVKKIYMYVWAVRSGDVAPVPEPQAWAMMLAGLGLVGRLARRRG